MEICQRASLLPTSIPTFVKKIICIGSISQKHVKCTNHIKITHRGDIRGISWHPSRTKFAACSNKSIQIWDEQGTLLHTISMAHGFYKIEGISWHPSGKKFATCSQDQCIKIWDEEGTLLCTFRICIMTG